MKLTRHLLIHGQVQGVGFRWSLCAEAEILGITGWVRNRHDGSVEALAQGPSAAVEALTIWARRGPPAAHVERIDSADLPAGSTENFSAFEKHPTH